MPKITQSVSSPEKMFVLNGLEYKKDVYEVFYLNKEVNSGSQDINTDKIKIGLRSIHYPSNIIQNPVLFSDYVDGSDQPYASFNDLITDLADLIGFNLGGGVGSVISVTQQVDTYNDLVAGDNIGELSYVENSQGTAWLPYSVGGTYYPKGFYLWDGTNWVSDRNAIANQLEQTILNVNSKLDKTGYSDISLPLLDTDELLVNRGGTWYKVDKSEIGGGTGQYPKVAFFDANIPQLTGTTATTKIKDCVIPANTIPENCMLRLTWQVMWNKSTNYKFFYATLNSINVNLGIIVNYIATNTNNTSFEIQEIQRNCVVKNGNLYVVKNSNLRSGYTTSLAEINSIDVTQDNTFNIWGKLNDGADNLDVLGFSIEIIK